VPPKKRDRIKKVLDESWRLLDIQDILQEQAKLRQASPARVPRAHASSRRFGHVYVDCDADCDAGGTRQAILEAVEDGMVDEKELFAIVLALKRTDLPKKTVKQVEEALGDGHMDEEDTALLMSLCPPSPTDDWDAILVLLNEDQGFIKTVFRFYCVEGATGNTNIDSMGLVQFSKFAKACKMVDNKKLKTHDVDRIFLRANKDRLDATDDVFKNQSTKKQMKKEVRNLDNELVVSEFAAALIRLAHARHRGIISIRDRLKALIEDQLRPNAMKEVGPFPSASPLVRLRCVDAVQPMGRRRRWRTSSATAYSKTKTCRSCCRSTARSW
jgi:hypothetical protein